MMVSPAPLDPRVDDAAPRRGVARILYSPGGRFRRVVFRAGDTKSFGRDERADVRIADEEIRGVHFELFFDGVAFYVRERGGAGQLLLDGRRAAHGEVRSGGFVVAGRTTVQLWLERRTPPKDPTPSPAFDAVMRVLGPLRDAGDLYGVFDGARSDRLRTLLMESVEEVASLYEGAEAAVYDEVAPYLVRFSKDSRLLERIVAEGWGEAWGSFFSTKLVAKDVRRHWRRFLMVLDETKNQKMYFRFYDPRVMREFYGVATPRQRAELLLGLDVLVLEAEDGALLTLAPDGGEA
ncbi:MAG TPA: DUF4123 domain-containing protein [Polyangiaceae bacterium]|jgi:hypothetical protein|nr:DUF4123 domain-containing protein [Polyangiaceae bacterium]